MVLMGIVSSFYILPDYRSTFTKFKKKYKCFSENLFGAFQDLDPRSVPDKDADM